jgi:hypothetical protein
MDIAVGGTVNQLSRTPNATALIYAKQDILDLPFYGENFTATNITSITAGRDICANVFGAVQSAARLAVRPAIKLLQAAAVRPSLHEGKTRLIEFGRFAAHDRTAAGQRRPETFNPWASRTTVPRPGRTSSWSRERRKQSALLES